MTPPLSRTLPDLLRENAELRGDSIAAICGARQASFHALNYSAQAVCGQLRKRGVRRRDRVGTILGNGIEWLEVAFGAMMAGATVVPFSTWSTRKELEFLLPDSDIRCLFAAPRFGDRDFESDLAEIAPSSLDLIGVGPNSRFESYEAFLAEASSDGPLPPGDGPSAGDDAYVLYTSGSTSAPKGVRLRHFGIVENGFNIGERQGLSSADRVLLSAPLFWSYGGANALPAAWSHGAALVLLEKFEPETVLSAIETHGCTSIYTLPAMTNALIRHPGFDRRRTATLRTGLTIGPPTDFLVAVQQLGVPNLCNIYGATEAYGNSAVTAQDWPLDKRARCQGMPLPGQEFRIRDEESGEVLGAHTAGLVEIRGYVTPGYSGASASLSETAFTQDGFYKTGDLGMLDDDGAFYFVGRGTEMIKRAGINVSPAEIEDVLLQFPGVSRAAVIGVPDKERGEIIVAFVVAETPMSLEAPVLLAHCRVELSKYKIPDHIELCETLPLTPTGKLQRKALLGEAMARYGSSARQEAVLP